MKIITSLKDFFDKGRVKTIFDHPVSQPERYSVTPLLQ
jgi:hypothetical protein